MPLFQRRSPFIHDDEPDYAVIKQYSGADKQAKGVKRYSPPPPPVAPLKQQRAAQVPPPPMDTPSDSGSGSWRSGLLDKVRERTAALKDTGISTISGLADRISRNPSKTADQPMDQYSEAYEEDAPQYPRRPYSPRTPADRYVPRQPRESIEYSESRAAESSPTVRRNMERRAEPRMERRPEPPMTPRRHEINDEPPMGSPSPRGRRADPSGRNAEEFSASLAPGNRAPQPEPRFEEPRAMDRRASDNAGIDAETAAEHLHDRIALPGEPKDYMSDERPRASAEHQPSRSGTGHAPRAERPNFDGTQGREKSPASEGTSMQEERTAASVARVEPRRSTVALDGDSNTINISKDSRFSGQLKFSGTIIVEGEVEGALEADRVIVRESGTASAKLSGESIMIAGKVTGDVLARRELEMASGGKLIGDVTTPQLLLDPGATIKGRCAIG